MAGTFNTTKTKQHTPGAVVYDALQSIRFIGGANYTLATDSYTSAAPGANTTEQARIILPCAMKIPGVIYNPGITGGTLPTATSNFNVVVATANNVIAESGAAPPNDTTNAGTTPPTVAVAGQSLFAADQRTDNIAGLTLDTPAYIACDNPDAIYPKGALLVLRFTGTGTQTKVSVTLQCVSFDPTPANVAQSQTQLAPANL